MTRQFTTFRIGENYFGLDILLMREINRQLDITPVEQGPDYVRGLINLRGQIVTVLDPAIRLGLGAQQIGPLSRSLVLKTRAELQGQRAPARLIENSGEDLVALLIDEVGDMITVEQEDIFPAPPHLRALDSSFLEGVVQLEQSLVAILRMSEMLDLGRAFSNA